MYRSTHTQQVSLIRTLIVLGVFACAMFFSTLSAHAQGYQYQSGQVCGPDGCIFLQDLRDGENANQWLSKTGDTVGSVQGVMQNQLNAQISTGHGGTALYGYNGELIYVGCGNGMTYALTGCEMETSSSQIQPGQSVTVTWASYALDYLTPTDTSLSPGVGSVPPAGSMSFAPSHTTKYVLTGVDNEFEPCAAGDGLGGPSYTLDSSGMPVPCQDRTVQVPYSCSAMVEVAGSGICPDGSSAPSGDPTLCSCAQGNLSACGHICPDGSQAPKSDPNQCSCAQGNQNACHSCPSGQSWNGSACTGGTCPSGEFTENQQCVGACDTGYVRQGNECVFSSCPSGYTQGTDANGDSICAYNTCPVGYIQQNGQCVFQGCPLGYAEQGTQCVFQGCPQGYSENSGLCVPAHTVAPSGDLIAVPILLKSGKTSEISWSAANVASCMVSGTNGDNWSCTGNACNATTTETTIPITAQTIYTLSCTGLDTSSLRQSLTISVAPNFCETGAPGCE
jgi:hypothetical protein